jgi:ribokinase
MVDSVNRATVPRIAVIGSNMMDLVTYVTRMPERGETLEAAQFALAHGGKGANQAVAAANLGSRILFVGKVGDDEFGILTLANFRAHGIDASHVGVVSGVASGVAPIFVEPNGENRILIVKGANDRLRPGDVEQARDDLATCAMILLQLEVPLETVYRAVELGVELAIPVVLNPAPATPQLDLRRLSGLAFLVPNQSELALLSGKPCATPAEAALAARAIVAAGVEAVIVTLGAHGALLVTNSEERQIAAVRVAPVDTTGAGDAFIGSFAHHFVAEHDVGAALEAAVRYAAHSVTRKGTQISYASRAEFDAFCSATKEI